MRFSAIILASRPASLRRCLESLAAAQPKEGFECLLVLNDDAQACAEVAESFTGRIAGLRLIRGAPASLGGARNAALRAAEGEWLCFLDDDVTVPPSYFSVLEEKSLRYPEACAIGGPNLTPAASPLFERCLGHLLGSWLGAGPMRRRCAAFDGDTWTDDRSLILCNLSFRRDALLREGLCFDEELVRNEENLLLEQLFSGGRRALHAPELRVYHERRATLAAFSRQCFLSGKGRAEMTLKRPSSLSAVHLAPQLLFLGLLGFFRQPWLCALLAAAYGAAAAFNAVFLALRHSEGAGALGWLLLTLPAAHLSYAAGFLAGLPSGLLRRLAAVSLDRAQSAPLHAD
ncbi:MAG: glycosyltransferase [Elusimicrobiota bacterium]